MAMATNDTPGSVILAGDLTGTANAPELRATGVIPGTYFPANIIVDAKGRIVWAKSSNWTEDVAPLVEDATYISKGIVQICDVQLSISGGILSLNMQDATTELFGKIRVDGGSRLEVVEDNEMKVKYATWNSKGIMQPGIGLDVIDGVLQLGDIPEGEKGTVSVLADGGILVSGGVISLDSVNYGKATTSHKGLVQVGSGLTVTNGVMSLSIPAAPTATTSVKGYVQVGTNIDVSAGVISIPTATTTTRGVVKPGSGVGILDGSITIADATTSSKGLMQVGNGLEVTTGVIRVGYATTTSHGLMRVGSGLSVTGGVVSADEATTVSKGIVQIGSGLSVTSGVVSLNAPDATTVSKGIVQIGSGLSVTSGVVSLTQEGSASGKGIVQPGTRLQVGSGVLSVINPLLTNTPSVVTKAQIHSTKSLTGTSINWNGDDSNVFTTSLTAPTTLNNGTNIVAGSTYHFVISDAQPITYGSQFKFRPAAFSQPSGSKSVLSCYAVDSNTLYCIMQPNFV